MDQPMAWNVTKNFDPFTQILDLKLPDGTIVPVGITDIDEWVQYGIRICINYGSSIGASIVMLAVLLILTNPEKRRTAVFILNCITLALNAIQRLLQCLYFTSSFYNPYAYFSGDYSRVPQHSISISVAGVVLQTIQIMCLEASLILQVRAVCVTMARIWQSVILGISILIALVVVGFRMAVMVLNSEYIVAIYSFADYQWLAATSLYTLTGSICFFSAIFTGKLFVALKQRRKLGLKKFGPMQIIFIMGCQTLIIPAIFSILQWLNGVPELGTQVLTLTSILLPLSAIWAAQTLNGGSTFGNSGNSGTSGRRRLLGFSRSGPSTKTETTASTQKSAMGESKNNTNTPATTASEPDTPRFSMKRDDDLESGGLHIFKRQSVDVSQEKILPK